LRLDEEPLRKSGIRVCVFHVEVQVRRGALPGVPKRDAGNRCGGIVSTYQRRQNVGRDVVGGLKRDVQGLAGHRNPHH
jgi:hypothetical protein